MNEYTLLWLFGGAYAGVVALGTGLTMLKIQMTGMQTTQDTLIRLLGNKAAFLLHSPHTPQLDSLIEKFHHESITPEEMQEFNDLLVSMETDIELPKGERLLAVLVLLALEQLKRQRVTKSNNGELEARKSMNIDKQP